MRQACVWIDTIFSHLDIYKKFLYYVLIIFTFWTYAIFPLINVLAFILHWIYASNFYNLIQLNVYFKNIFLHIFLICPIFLFFVDITLFLFAYVHLLRDASIRCAGCLMQNRHERYEARHSLRGLSHTKFTWRLRDASIRKQSFLMRGLSPHKRKESQPGFRKRNLTGILFFYASRSFHVNF